MRRRNQATAYIGWVHACHEAHAPNPLSNCAAHQLRGAAIAARVLPAGLLFYFVHRLGVDLPFWDEWVCYVPMFSLRDRGALSLRYVLESASGEHRVMFTTLLTLANSSLFHWDREVEMYLSVVFLMFVYGLTDLTD